MAARPSNFRQQDVTRAINAAKRAGLSIARVEVDPKTAKITVIVGEPELPPANAAEADEWQDEIDKLKAKARKSENYWDTATMAPIGRRRKSIASTIDPHDTSTWPIPETKPRRRKPANPGNSG
jgi:hypothetical protein